jgi:hypothetical protein
MSKAKNGAGSAGRHKGSAGRGAKDSAGRGAKGSAGRRAKISAGRRAKKNTARKRRGRPEELGKQAASDPSAAFAAPDFGFPTGPFGESIGRIFDLQRKVWKAGSAAARSAADNPASKLIKEGVADSVQGGLRKLEQVFDERVASALHRMAMPSPDALRALCDTVAKLRATVARLTAAPRARRSKSPKGG